MFGQNAISLIENKNKEGNDTGVAQDHILLGFFGRYIYVLSNYLE